MINRVVLVGRLTRDPDIRKTQSGMTVASFTVAVDNPRAQNAQEKTASFIPCTAWNKQAEFMDSFTRKGHLVGIEGRLNQRSYDSKDGKKVQVIEVICDNIQLLEKKDAAKSAAEPLVDVEPSNNGYVPDPRVEELEDNSNVESIDVADDDLPF
jgi:single-strand DNA-binding protein